MGATKRIAEHLVHHYSDRKSSYVSVRFGNVLGSRGSVVPTFMRQIADGGPVTITHPDMTRYFMTIPEAVQLVLQAAALGNDGEVFVLDMGEPVRIVDLAERMIALSGKHPGRDIEIEFVGARPGEKLHEELWAANEIVSPSSHEAILQMSRDPIDAVWLEQQLGELLRLVEDGETLEVVGRLTAMTREPQRVSRGLEADAQVASASETLQRPV